MKELESLISSIDVHHYWLIIGFGLMLLEFVMGNFVLFCLGLSGVVVGAALWGGLPNENGYPFLLFAVSSVGLVFGLRAKLRELFEKTDAANDLKDDFIGRDVSIESGFDHATPGIGKVNYRGASWKAKSATLHWEAGQIAVVVSRESSLLIIGKE